MIRSVAERGERPDISWVTENSWEQSGQERLSQKVSESIGFDFEAGRRDASTHPFCGGQIRMMLDGPQDIVILIRLDHCTALCMRLVMVHTSRADREM